MDCKTNHLTFWGGLSLTEKDAFCEQIRRCDKAMYSLAFSIVRNEADAGAVISEAIYRAYKNLNTLKNRKAFQPWILRIVHNTAVEMIRKNSKIIPIDEMEDTVGEANEYDITTRLALRDAVKSLKQPYRTVVILFYYENLSVTDIAQITDTSYITVKKQLSRARKMLREILKEDCNG